jgi:RNA polymerase sigma-70 factor (ECF subfamily)
MERPDKIILLEAQRGSLGAFEAIVRRYEARVLAFLTRFNLSVADREDITQETFIAFYTQLAKVDPQRPIFTYLCEIAKNKAISLLRKYRRHTPLSEEIAAFEEDRIGELDQALNRRRIKPALAMLAPVQQQVIKLYYFENFDYKNISRRLHLPLNTVRTHLRRAKLKLRELLI